MTLNDSVRRALADLARADASVHAPPHLEQALRAGFERHHARGRLTSAIGAYWRQGTAAIVTAAAIIIVAVLAPNRLLVRWDAPEPPVPSPAP